MIRVLVADDHPVVREGLKRLLGDLADIRIVAEAADGHELLRKAAATRVDVLLLDVGMPGPGFLELLSQLRARNVAAAVLVLSVYPEDQYAVRAIRAGAAGYLTKNSPLEQLAEAIRRVARGLRYVTPTVAERLAIALGTGDQPLHAALSDRELRVLCLAAAGKTVKEIASELRLSPKTVSTYRSRLLAKMRLSTHVEAVTYAIRSGLVD